MKFTLNGTHPKVTNLNRLSKRNAMGDQIDLNKQNPNANKTIGCQVSRTKRPVLGIDCCHGPDPLANVCAGVFSLGPLPFTQLWEWSFHIGENSISSSVAPAQMYT